MNKNKLGKYGEKIAEKYLREKKVKIINKNYYTRYGEIDLVGIQSSTIIFFEVKCRTNTVFGVPEESISSMKKSHLKKAAQCFIVQEQKNRYDYRFDLITVFIQPDGTHDQINWLENVIF